MPLVKWIPLLIILEALDKIWNLLSYDDIFKWIKNDFINVTYYTNALAFKNIYMVTYC